MFNLDDADDLKDRVNDSLNEIMELIIIQGTISGRFILDGVEMRYTITRGPNFGDPPTDIEITIYGEIGEEP
jgi:hypothetical protein